MAEEETTTVAPEDRAALSRLPTAGVLALLAKTCSQYAPYLAFDAHHTATVLSFGFCDKNW